MQETNAEISRPGGGVTTDGSRPRTAGGVFFKIAKQWCEGVVSGKVQC